MPRKPKPIPAAERERLKERLKTLIYAGHNVREASEMCGVEETTAQKWATRYGWRKEIKQVKELVAQSSENVPNAKTILFDRLKTGRETRDLLSKTALRTAQFMSEQPAEMIFAGAGSFKQITDAAAKIDGTWEDASANKFAVSLHINQLVQSGAITPIPEGAVVEIED